MFSRFSPEAKAVIVSAQEEARDLFHDWIGTEHLLLGLTAQPDDPAARVLRARWTSGARPSSIADTFSAAYCSRRRAWALRSSRRPE
jgi:ATP-dependent Clp protease ATP-binding subunit ClpA